MKLVRVLLLLSLFMALLPVPTVMAEESLIPRAQSILDTMTPEERVGQLFLVTFNGTDTSEVSQIYDLITQNHVGGVVLQAQNDNFAPLIDPNAPPATEVTTDVVAQTHQLIESIQSIEWNSSLNPVISTATGQEIDSPYVPLFVGISQEGDGFPTDQLLSGLTPLPSEMSIGATWNPDYAQRVGEVRGRELSALGVNLYLGPLLDVLESPSISGGDLGPRVFGGDPFWVGELGRAYITGLHSGSDDQLVVIAKHFPGVGGSDRLPEEEVSTVRKSLEQLKQIELYPFFAVTGNAPSAESTVDGLLVSHIRYQGFQGNIRATTRPISFDPQALNQILALPQFASWVSAGGLVVSDDLGTRAVSDFYNIGGGQFSARTAARDAFLAGNDMLYLGNIQSLDSPNTFNTTKRVIEFFVQKYREDPAFAQRVDNSVTRILAAKLNIYKDFTFSNVAVPSSRLAGLGTGTAITFEVARNSATLISPEQQDLTGVLPLPPQSNERMVFITDTQTTRQCTTCPELPIFATDALQQSILQLYGPQSGNQTANFRLTSYSLANLEALLDDLKPEFIEEDIVRANWVVISLRDASQGQPAVIERFLRERPDLLRQKNLILFSFGAPYYFDTTTTSKFTAYYALYSKQAQFVEVAARLLFQELTPTGASPVSIQGIGYDLISVMAPDPNQIIPLSLDLEPASASTDEAITPEPTPIPLFQIGDTIAIRTGVIKDANGHAVPDGTVVQFSMLLTGEGSGILQQVDAVTSKGVARAAFGLDKPGLLEIRVVSEPAVISEVLKLDVTQSGAVAVTVVVPELTESAVPTPEPPVVVIEDSYVSLQGYPRISAWLVAMLFIALITGLIYAAGSRFWQRHSAIRWSLGALLGGLLAYNMLAFGVFDSTAWLPVSGISGLVAYVLAGELLGLAAGWVWSRL